MPGHHAPSHRPFDEFEFDGPILVSAMKSTSPGTEGVFETLLERAISGKSTLVMSAASEYLLETGVPFDRANTPINSSPLAEKLLRCSGAVRSLHPFDSYVALGPQAESICSDNSPHAWGARTPIGRLFDLGGTALHLDNESTVDAGCLRHMELLMGVPYRYTREYRHGIIRRNGDASELAFYRFEYYRDIPVNESSCAAKLFAMLDALGDIHRADAGGILLHFMDLRTLYNRTARHMKHDLYALLERVPAEKPFRT